MNPKLATRVLNMLVHRLGGLAGELRNLLGLKALRHERQTGVFRGGQAASRIRLFDQGGHASPSQLDRRDRQPNRRQSPFSH